MNEKILIIDDKSEERDLRVDILNAAGFEYRCKGIASGEEALFDIKANLYDLIFVSSSLKDIDVFTLSQKIRKVLTNVRICLLTDHGSENEKQRATQMCLEYYDKDMEYPDLINAIENVID